MNFKKIICGMCLTLSLFCAVLPFGTAAEDISCDGYKEALSDNIQVKTRLGELLFAQARADKSELIPGGGVFGIRIKQKHVTITDSTGIPALAPGDIILSVNGKDVHTVEEVKAAIESCGGKSVTIKALHNGTEVRIEAHPSQTDGVYRLGLGLRDGASGIGTITFYDPKTGVFGGLGHGICDSETGDVIEMDTGIVTGVILGGVHKGESGKPGELSGILKDRSLGSLSKNDECGVYGILSSDDIIPKGEAIPIGTKADIHEGEAKIISTLKTGKTAEYKIEIYDIDRSSEGSKSFRIRTTDTALTAISGGIVRGMSGSPIIQDGKLVGAVTHVMVADPKEGYGIFIENMLNSLDGAKLQKAA